MVPRYLKDWFEQSTNFGGFSCPICRSIPFSINLILSLMYMFNRTSNRRNDFIKLTWFPDHLKWVNDRTKELENTKLNQ